MSVQRVCIGFDPRQPLAFTVAAHSIWSRATKPVEIIRLQLSQLPITRRGLTEFTYSRFLVPFLSDYSGYSLFVDADMLCLGDITEIKASDPMAEVSVVMHERKFERPSLMLFNCKRCKVLTPEYVEDKTHGLLDLYWAGRIGKLPAEWNHLVGYDAPNPDAKMLHFTQGIPCWPQTSDQYMADEWHKESKRAMSTVSFNDLMGNSVHPIAEKVRANG